MGKVNPLLALARQQLLASAAGRVVDESLPQLTSIDAALPPTRSYKTNPIPSQPTHRPTSGAVDRRPLLVTPTALRLSPALDRSLPQLTPVDGALPKLPLCKTNPIGSEAPLALTPRQLAAARLTARGRRVAEIAAELGVSRQSLWTWSRQPAFIAEVRRLHDLLARQPDAFRQGERRRGR